MPAGQQHYTGAEGAAYHGGKRAIPDEAFDWVARLRAERLAGEVSPRDVVFEYGVGSGWNLAALKCAEKIGYDVSSFLGPELAKRGIRFVPKTSDLPEAFADAIICYHTLEHVISPAEVLGELRRWLKPGCKLLLFVPFEKERRYRTFNPREPNHHLFSWNVQTLGNLVEECGWSIRSAGVQRYGYERIAGKHAVRFKLGEPGFRLIRALVWLVAPILEVRLIARPKR
jgi:SAM-dependent methyltransferase